MKKYIIFLFITVGMLISCNIHLDDNFDQKAAERIDKQVADAYDILTSAANGWVIEYYPDANQSYGGVNILAKFNSDNSVEMINESAVNIAETKTSSYVINRSQAAVLAFNTYNEYISYYADPSVTEAGGKRYGYMGDLDFAIKSASDSEVVMQGTKTKNKIVMKPIPSGMTWTEYLTAIKSVKDALYDSYVVKFVLNYGENELELTSDPNYLLLSYPYTDEEGLEKNYIASYIYTDTGIKFYEPMKIYGIEMQNFIWDESTLRFNCTDAGATDAFLQGKMEDYFRPYEYYLGEWKLYCSGTAAVTGGHSITITELEHEKTMTITGISYYSGSTNGTFSFPITLTWRRSGLVEIIGGQTVGEKDVISSGVSYPDMTIYVYACTSTSRISTAGAGVVSTKDWNDNPNRVDFENNGISSTCEGLSYYYTLNGTSWTTAGRFLVPMYMVKQ